MKLAKHWKLVVLLSIYEIIFVCISFFLLKRVGAFGCFDDCFNFGAGDFILQGKRLYSQIFFNHQPLMAYISALIQYITHPKSLFELVKYHRLFVMLIANCSGLLLLIRFGSRIFFPLVIFESLKFYLFGDRFLAEGLIVYPMMYVSTLLFKTLWEEKIHNSEYILISVCCWFIIWMREPFIPWAFFVWFFTIWMSYKQKPRNKWLLVSIIVFVLFQGITCMVLPMSSYIENVILSNLSFEVSVQPWSLQTIGQIFFYPLFLLFGGIGSGIQPILFTLSLVFCITLVLLGIKKEYKILITTILLLGFLNIRVVPIGSIYYDAFHLIPWFGVYCATIFLMIERYLAGKRIMHILQVLFMFVLTVIVVAPNSYIHERVDTQKEFTIGYGNYFVKGEVVKAIAKQGDTVFVEMWEDPIYIVSRIPSAYPYAWYTSIMPKIPLYVAAREHMFEQNPPTLYVGACRIGEADSFPLTAMQKDMYVQLLVSGKPSCVYVKKTALPLPSSTIEKIKTFKYSIPQYN